MKLNESKLALMAEGVDMLNSFQKSLVLALAVASSLAVTACSSGGGGGSAPSCDAWCQLAKNPTVNKSAWYNASAQVCNGTSGAAPAAGCDFSWTGQKVVLTEDPNAGALSSIQLVPGSYNTDDQIVIPATVGHAAIILYDASAGAAPLNYNGWTISYNGDYTYSVNSSGGSGGTICGSSGSAGGVVCTSGGTTVTTTTYTYGMLSLLSPDGVLYDINGNALNFVGAESSSSGRDVLGGAADREAESVNVLSQGLQAKYSLDAEASLNMAKVIAQDIKRPANRAYSENELNAMTSQMYNIRLGDMKKVSELAQSGDFAGARSQAQTLINTAAAANRTSPENMQRMLTDFYGNLLPVGITAQ